MIYLRRIACLVLLTVLILSTYSCAGNNKPDLGEISDNLQESESKETTDITSADTSVDDNEENYDGVFQAGYGIADITPDLPIALNTGKIMTQVSDPLYATCIAVHDGENTALIITADVKNISAKDYNAIRKRISTATKVPLSNIIMSATHNHSAPTPNSLSNDRDVATWTARITNNFVQAAKDAIADLSDADVYVGTGKTTNMAFVRCYVHEDGGITGINTRLKNNTPVVRHVTEADDNIQIIRFVRKDKKDIVMTNWQAHVASAIGKLPTSITSDLVFMLRRELARKEDFLFAYYQGASGNINLTTPIESLRKYNNNYQDVGRALAKVILDKMDELEPVKKGKIQSLDTNLTVDKRVETDTVRIAQAKEVAAAGPEDSAAYNDLLDKYKFHSKYEVRSIISRRTTPATSQMLLSAISFGDLGFVTAPFEMYDTSGMQIKEGSPYKMTFVLTCAGDWGGYVPSADAVQYGNYEVYMTSYKFGTAEEVVAKLLEMLNKIR